ncbi:ferritin-like domain-containing protein [Azospirillum canadense]|uniref:ferritin-like domain-containing protein n=1 Tax=Azospirillum canadense TaxID=403962 RepID=UPI0022278318|nr:ferritin-like domain-containing protein [Azospirillum canadense]MCW2238261.1 ferritin-like metal-binding protein YciE [Azospirillum canadense]
MASPSNVVNDIFIAGLRNTHALEMEALQIMNRQVERVQNYPELEQALRQHIAETEQQRKRIEEAMKEVGVTPSSIKEAIFGLMGNVGAVAHVPAADEILKNMFANHAFENYEIAAYKSLIVMAEAAGFKNISGFQQSLREEEAMAQKMNQLVEPITRKYISLEQKEKMASH